MPSVIYSIAAILIALFLWWLASLIWFKPWNIKHLYARLFLQMGIDSPELLTMLGIQVSQSTVARYMVRTKRPPSQTWRTFLDNHTKDLVSIDFCTVPTATFEVLFVFLVLSHDRRKVIHFNATDKPTAEWTAHQITEAFPFDTAPKYLIRI